MGAFGQLGSEKRPLLERDKVPVCFVLEQLLLMRQLGLSVEALFLEEAELLLKVPALRVRVNFLVDAIVGLVGCLEFAGHFIHDAEEGLDKFGLFDV